MRSSSASAPGLLASIPEPVQHPVGDVSGCMNLQNSSSPPARANRKEPLIFVSYCRDDQRITNGLINHFKAVSLGERLAIWSDENLTLGGTWESELNDAMLRADVAILIISEAFLNSDYIRTNELPLLLERRASGSLLVVPVIARPVAWKNISWLREINLRPRNGVALMSKGGARREQVYVSLVDEIVAYLDGRALGN